jgi:hypothetical protein
VRWPLGCVHRARRFIDCSTPKTRRSRWPRLIAPRGRSVARSKSNWCRLKITGDARKVHASRSLHRNRFTLDTHSEPDSIANWRSPVLFVHGDDDRNFLNSYLLLRTFQYPRLPRYRRIFQPQIGSVGRTVIRPSHVEATSILTLISALRPRTARAIQDFWIVVPWEWTSCQRPSLRTNTRVQRRCSFIVPHWSFPLAVER